jgi:hypothetical protein
MQSLNNLCALLLLSSATLAAPALGPLSIHPTNPRYFTDGTKGPDGTFKAVYLTGSHTWGNLADSNEHPEFNFTAYLDFLGKYNHNFIRLWSGYNLGRAPIPYERSGSTAALDGQPKVDLTRFDPRFFERLRTRVIAARDRGIYVGIMLFAPDGAKKEDWPILLFNPANNTQAINADTNGDGSGAEAYDLSIPEITKLEEEFVRKVINTVHDLDNVLFEIGNEGDRTSVRWQHHFIRFIKDYERGKPEQHPIGMTSVFNIRNGSWAADDNALLDSPADWISPGSPSYKGDPPAADGRKVIIADVDHIWPAAPHAGWVWRCFLRGLQPILMDQYSYGDPKWTSVAEQDAMRKNMGYTLTYANRVNLATLAPRSDLASSKYCLANPGTEYLVYQPKAGEAFSVELQLGIYRYEWFDPTSGTVAGEGRVEALGGSHQFEAPFKSPSVLYLWKSASR